MLAQPISADDVLRCCMEAGIPAPAVRIDEDGTGLTLLIRCQRPD